MVTENRKQFYKQKLSKSRAFLKNGFSFTSAKYYTEIWMIYGIGIGISIITAIDAVVETRIGLWVGTGVGMIYGARKNAEAKRQGKVI